MSKGQEEANTAKNGPVIQGQVHAIDHSPCVSDSSDGDEELDESAVSVIFATRNIFYKYLDEILSSTVDICRCFG